HLQKFRRRGDGGQTPLGGATMPALMRLSILLLFVFAPALASLAGCQGGPGSCLSGALCECSGGTDCYQGCADGNGCDLLCHHMVHCGGVCGAGCALE